MCRRTRMANRAGSVLTAMVTGVVLVGALLAALSARAPARSVDLMPRASVASSALQRLPLLLAAARERGDQYIVVMPLQGVTTGASTRAPTVEQMTPAERSMVHALTSRGLRPRLARNKGTWPVPLGDAGLPYLLMLKVELLATD